MDPYKSASPIQDANTVFSKGLKEFNKAQFPKSAKKKRGGSQSRQHLKSTQSQERRLKTQDRKNLFSAHGEHEFDESYVPPCLKEDKIIWGPHKIKLSQDMKCSSCHSEIFSSHGKTAIYLGLNSGDIKCSSCEEEINQASKDGQVLTPLLKVPLSNVSEHDTGFLNREI